MAEREVRKALMTLAQDLRVKEQPDAEAPHPWKTIPQHLHHLVPGKIVPGSPPSLGMSRRTYRLYRRTLALLLAERRRRALSDVKSDRELGNSFWSFCCEIVLDDSFRAPAAQKSKVEAFMEEIDIPCLEYEAIVQVTGIAVPHHITLGEIELIRGSPTLLKEWDLWSNLRRPQWRGQTVARLRVTGGTPRAAQYRALDRVSMVCDELRIALSASINANVDDIDLAFGTGWSVVRGNGAWMHQPGRLLRKPVRWHADSLRTALAYLVPLYDLRATARANVQERVEIAIRWFGVSWTVGAPWSMKLIALFAGLEAILVKGEGERMKGAALAIRAALLSIAMEGHFRDPGEALALYRDRSELVHGARTAVHQEAFRRTFSVASEALRNYIAIANREMEIHNHKRLLDSFADNETLSDLKRWIEGYSPWGEKELLAATNRLMK